MTGRNKNIIFIVSLIIFAVYVFFFWEYSIDDAFITFRYAENLIDGHGLVFNPGDRPVEAFSNFLWLLILAGFYALGFPTYFVAKVLGAGFFPLTAFLWRLFLKDREDDYLFLAPILFLVAPFAAFWAVSGLELGLHSFLISAAIISASRKSYWAALFWALVVLSRPEGFLVALGFISVAWILERRYGAADNNYSIIILSAVAVTFLSLVVFRLIVFGYPMPNTFYMKSRFTYQGLTELGKISIYFLPLILTFIWGAIKTDKRSKSGRAAILCGFLFILQAGISALALAVMNFHGRYLVSFLPLLFIAGFHGLGFVRRRLLSGITLAAIFICPLFPLKSIIATIENERGIIAAQKQFVEWAQPLPAETRLSITDAGRIPYFSRKYYIDIWGLASHDIAHYGFNPLLEYLRFPDYFIFVGYLEDTVAIMKYGTEELISRGRGFRQVYPLIGVARPPDRSAFARGYYYLVFRKNQDALDSLLKEHPIK
jgi:hypothetical protein